MKDLFLHRKNKVYVYIISVQGMWQSRLMWETLIFNKTACKDFPANKRFECKLHL